MKRTSIKKDELKVGAIIKSKAISIYVLITRIEEDYIIGLVFKNKPLKKVYKTQNAFVKEGIRKSYTLEKDKNLTNKIRKLAVIEEL